MTNKERRDLITRASSQRVINPSHVELGFLLPEQVSNKPPSITHSNHKLLDRSVITEGLLYIRNHVIRNETDKK